MMQKSDKIRASQIWGQHEIAENEICTWNVGPLQIWCKRTEKEMQLAYKHYEEDEGQERMPENPEELVWIRWASEKKQDKIEFVPVLPDRPLVVKPESPFWLTRSIKANIYVRIPVWVQINLAGRKKAKPMMEIPSIILSNTWFGTFFEGELSYWISTGARRKIDPDPQRPFLAICPIQLTNSSDEDLLVEKICLRVENHSLFILESQLWTDLNKIVYKGESEVSQVQVSGTPPGEAKGADLISYPRSPQKKNLVAKTFASIKDLPGLGIPTN